MRFVTIDIISKTHVKDIYIDKYYKNKTYLRSSNMLFKAANSLLAEDIELTGELCLPCKGSRFRAAIGLCRSGGVRFCRQRLSALGVLWVGRSPVGQLIGFSNILLFFLLRCPFLASRDVVVDYLHVELAHLLDLHRELLQRGDAVGSGVLTLAVAPVRLVSSYTWFRVLFVNPIWATWTT